MSKSISKYTDTRETIYGQMQEILVVCPRCAACARIIPRPTAEPPAPGNFALRRVVCRACGFIKEREGRGLGFDWYADPMRDSYFELPLWLQTRCCGHVLWAYNHHHLSLIERYIRAQLREHRKDPKDGWCNSSLVNRLPEWMIVAKHRQAVLDAIQKIKSK